MAFENAWEKFENRLQTIVPSLEPIIFQKMKSSFVDIHPTIIKSPEFKDFLKTTLDSYSNDSSNIYKKLLDFKKTLKTWKKKKRKLDDDASETPTKVFIKEEKALVEEEMKRKEELEKKANEEAKQAAAIEQKTASEASTKANVSSQDNSTKIREFNIFEAFNFNSVMDKNEAPKSAKKKSLKSPTKTNQTKSLTKSIAKRKPIRNVSKVNPPKLVVENDKISEPSNVQIKSEPVKTNDRNSLDVIQSISASNKPKVPTATPQVIIDDNNEKSKGINSKPGSLFSEKLQKRIDKLEKILHDTQREIEKREEEELDFNDLDDECSSYVHLDKLKTHCVKIWKSMDKLKKEKNSLDMKYYKKFTYEEMPYKELNKRIEKFVRTKRFPDYNDIQNLVQKFGKDKRVAMSTQKINHLSQEIFLGVGNKLKKLRITNFEKYFGNHLTDQVRITDDPILKDETLRRNLNKNLFEGKAKLDKVLKEYTNKSLETEGFNDSEPEEDIATDTDTEELQKEEEEDEEEESEEEEEEEMIDYEDDEAISPPEKATEDTPQSPPAPINDTEVEDPQNKDSDNNDDVIEIPRKRTDSANDRFALVSSHRNDSQDQIKEEPPEQIAMEVIEIKETAELPKPVKVLENKLPEEKLVQLKKHTFEFNYDQLEKGAESKYYNEIVTIDDDDDDDDDSKDGCSVDSSDVSEIPDKNGNDIENKSMKSSANNKCAYSSKADKIIYETTKKEDIFITLDDSDDEKDILC